MALTRITQGVIKPNENYDTHNINSTGIVTATALNISGDASIGGVLTYEDVTNVDSVGLLTARSGIRFGGHILPTVNESYDIGSADYKVRHLFLSDNSLKFVDSSDTEHPLSLDSGRLKFAGGMLLGSDIQLDPISGIITATNFVKGDGGPLGGFFPDAQNNLTAGTNAGNSLDGSSAEYNILIGHNAGRDVDNDDDNIMIGREAGLQNKGYQNILIGWEAAKNLHSNFNGTSSQSIVIGAQAALSKDYANGAVIIGCQSGKDLHGGGESSIGAVYIGYEAGGGSYNQCTFVGYAAGSGTSSGCWYSTGVGSRALANDTKRGNTGTGYYVGYYLDGGQHNTLSGYEAGKGFNSGVNAYHDCVAIGSSTGKTMRSNMNTILIGAGAEPTSDSVSNEVTIGNTDVNHLRIPGLSITIDSNGISDAKGNLRSIPQQNEQGSTHTLVAADAGKHILADNTVTVPPTSGIFSAGDAITIVNAGSSDISIAKGSGVTMYNAADGTDAGRTLAAKGMATILCGGSNTYYISGAGLS